MLNVNSRYVCAIYNERLFYANHDKCVLDYVQDVNVLSKSKPTKRNNKKQVWKPTGKVYTAIGYIWKLTGRTFTIVRNKCPLTRFTSTKVVPLKETPTKSVVTPTQGIMVYCRRPKVPKSVVPKVATLEPAVIPSSTLVDQDASSPSTSQTPQESLSHVIPPDVEEADHDIKSYKEALIAPVGLKPRVIKKLVPHPDCVMIITLKWIYKVKLNELGGVLKTKARHQRVGMIFSHHFYSLRSSPKESLILHCSSGEKEKTSDIMNQEQIRQVTARDEKWVLAKKESRSVPSISSGTLSRRVQGIDFAEFLDDEATLTFLLSLGYKGPLHKHPIMYVDHMHQPMRALASIINKCLSGKTASNDKLRKSRIDILWGMFYKENVDYPKLIWEDFAF
uniref:Uncharacterized protein n=1 Tax=Tanacetum cinerariifolium TaxID=118510 RepID=A0A6L2K678_TANCI|nr:hypothetical protein [Tanacetum cinerariifolium]